MVGSKDNDILVIVVTTSGVNVSPIQITIIGTVSAPCIRTLLRLVIGRMTHSKQVPLNIRGNVNKLVVL